MKFSFSAMIGSLSILSSFCSAAADKQLLRGSLDVEPSKNKPGSRELQDCPPNGFWDAANNKCSCQSWDVWTGDACCPANAFFDWTASQCTCNSDFQWDGSSCVSTGSSTSGLVNPVTECNGDGGACGCGLGGDGHLISMNRFWGDDNDEQVFGCGGAFALDGASWDAQWGGTLSESGPEANVLQSIGVSFSQGASFDGWEGCCLICGANLQMTGKISSGWYCQKDLFSTGIWLKGRNK